MSLPYGAVVLEHFRHPRNQRALEHPSASHEAFNPLCGDRVRLELLVEEGTIRDAGFTANACVICTASASMLTERVLNVATADAEGLTDDAIVNALGTELPAARVPCAVLPLTALREALRQVPA